MLPWVVTTTENSEHSLHFILPTILGAHLTPRQKGPSETIPGQPSQRAGPRITQRLAKTQIIASSLLPHRFRLSGSGVGQFALPMSPQVMPMLQVWVGLDAHLCLAWPHPRACHWAQPPCGVHSAHIHPPFGLPHSGGLCFTWVGVQVPSQRLRKAAEGGPTRRTLLGPCGSGWSLTLPLPVGPTSSFPEFPLSSGSLHPQTPRSTSFPFRVLHICPMNTRL